MGNVARIRMKRILGHQLDENAMAAVKTWRFTPGTRNGEPVAVSMDIEVIFNRY
jgi:protein TonB